MIAGYFGISNMGFSKRKSFAARATVEAAIQKSLRPGHAGLPGAARLEARECPVQGKEACGGKN